MTTEDRLALRLRNIINTAKDAERRGAQLDPRTIITLANGKARA